MYIFTQGIYINYTEIEIYECIFWIFYVSIKFSKMVYLQEISQYI